MRALAIFLVLFASDGHAEPAGATITGHVVPVQNGKAMADPPPLWVWAEEVRRREGR